MQPGVPFVGGWHLGAVCDHLQALFFGHIRNLLINIPPRSTKSVSCCVALPAWGWIHKPFFKYLFTSYASSLSVRDSMATRDLILSDWYQQRWGDRFSLSIDKNKQDRFSTSENGYRIASSVGGSVIGEGADLLCFPRETEVLTDAGPIPIGDIVEKELRVKVWSYNLETQEDELREIETYFKNPGSELVQVTLSNGDTFRCTPNHKVWTEGRGWVEAQYLLPTDNLKVFGDLVIGESTDFPVFVGKSDTVENTFCLSIRHNHNFYVQCRKTSYLFSNCSDDPQNINDATFSKTIRDRGNNFVRRILATRMNDPKTARRLIVMQRFHMDDVCGNIMERDKRGLWTKLILPLEYESKRSCQTILLPKYIFDKDTSKVIIDKDYKPTKRWEDPREEEGELLCPERFGPEELEQISEDLEVWDRAGQFQQLPAPPGGGMFPENNWVFYRTSERPSEIVRSCISWDLPVKDKQRSSFMVGQLWVFDGIDYWLITQRRKRASYVKQRDCVLEMYRDYPWVDAVVIEDKATGPAIIEELSSLIPCIEEYEPEGDKVARAASIASIQSNGHLRVPDPTEFPWVKHDYLAELSVFPNSTYKDQTDTTVQAIRWLKTYGGRLIRRKRKKAIRRNILISGI